ncbi:MAG: hypothetical protein ACT4TC_16850 [Myxococcaceae bacterium]
MKLFRRLLLPTVKPPEWEKQALARTVSTEAAVAMGKSSVVAPLIGWSPTLGGLVMCGVTLAEVGRKLVKKLPAYSAKDPVFGDPSVVEATARLEESRNATRALEGELRARGPVRPEEPDHTLDWAEIRTTPQLQREMMALRSQAPSLERELMSAQLAALQSQLAIHEALPTPQVRQKAGEEPTLGPEGRKQMYCHALSHRCMEYRNLAKELSRKADEQIASWGEVLPEVVATMSKVRGEAEELAASYDALQARMWEENGRGTEWAPPEKMRRFGDVINRLAKPIALPEDLAGRQRALKETRASLTELVQSARAFEDHLEGFRAWNGLMDPRVMDTHAVLLDKASALAKQLFQQVITIRGDATELDLLFTQDPEMGIPGLGALLNRSLPGI